MMPDQPYNQYLFYALDRVFHALPSDTKKALKDELQALLEGYTDATITPYATRGFKVGTTFMLWMRAASPEALQELVRLIEHSGIAQYLTLSYTYFGIVKPSVYSGRVGRPSQVVQNFEDRLPYLTLYPFTKTTEWYQLSDEERRSIMGEHIKTGISHGDVRQCLLYSYGLDDYEFVVSYEMNTLEEFQDVLLDMRKTKSRIYTHSDTPIFTALYKPLSELIDWL
jgi:chlorite dismutase